MTAESTRTVQYEAVGPALSVVDGMTTSVFEWVQTVPTGDVVFSVRIPASAGTVEIDPVPSTQWGSHGGARGQASRTARPVWVGG
jgi:hypothetical protein